MPNVNDVLGRQAFHRVGRKSTGSAFTEESYGSAVAMTAGAVYTAGGKVYVNASAAGTITFTLADGSLIAVSVGVGGGFFPLRVTSWAASGGAAATVYNLS
jgi:hypothetical protein